MIFAAGGTAGGRVWGEGMGKTQVDISSKSSSALHHYHRQEDCHQEHYHQFSRCVAGKARRGRRRTILLAHKAPASNKNNDNDKDNNVGDDDDNGKASVWQRTQWPDTFPLPPGGDKFSPNQVSPSRHHRRRHQHFQHTL